MMAAHSLRRMGDSLAFDAQARPTRAIQSLVQRASAAIPDRFSGWISRSIGGDFIATPSAAGARRRSPTSTTLECGGDSSPRPMAEIFLLGRPFPQRRRAHEVVQGPRPQATDSIHYDGP